MYKRIHRKILPLFISSLLLFYCIMPISFAAAPAEAEVIPYGTGTTTGKIRLNNTFYDVRFSVGGSLSQGGRSIFVTDGRCIRQHKDVSVVFYTAETGQEVYYGGATTYNGIYNSDLEMYMGSVGTTYSYYVPYGGYETPTGLRLISANITVKTVWQFGNVYTYNFYTSS